MNPPAPHLSDSVNLPNRFPESKSSTPASLKGDSHIIIRVACD